jgi:hypothetical protein
MHVSDRRQLDSLRHFPGARVLDQFNPAEAFQSNLRTLSRPILPGNFSFVIADSMQSIIYRRDGLRLRALPAATDTTRSTAATSNLRTPSTPSNEPPAAAPPIISPRAINDTTQRLANDTLRLRDNFNQ